MKINKLLAAIVVAAFALPAMAQTAAAPAAPAAAPAADAAAPAAPAKKAGKKHHHKKSHKITATPVNKGA
ncbi:hypothetical protein [Collimonas fungivorans]|uniref:hypothetical protein n=1 Tax=Collimonas fungivorans TaxID=158899 RepID=UPI0002EA751B|nr:hypothetical protein [Collimonas fungivorans]